MGLIGLMKVVTFYFGAVQICSLHTCMSCYTSSVTSIFSIAACQTPCGVSINKYTSDLPCFQFRLLIVWLCVCSPVVRRAISKDLNLTETGIQSTKVPVVRVVCVPLWWRHS